MGMNKKTRQATPAPNHLETLIAQSAPAAFDLVRPEIAAVPANALAPINLDIPPAARRGLVVAERIGPLMPELAKLHRLDFRIVSNLHTYALALIHAHALVDHTEEEVPPLSVLVAEATPLRASMLATADMLAHFGLVTIERVDAIRRGKGYADLADDLLALALLLRALWGQVKDRIFVTRADVDRAVILSTALHKALGTRESDADPLAEPSDPRFVRAQAYTLFTRAYRECRRGVIYLRWHEGDALRIVPSLRTRRPSQPKLDDEVELEDAADDLLDPGVGDEPENASMPAPTTNPVAEPAAGALTGT